MNTSAEVTSIMNGRIVLFSFIVLLLTSYAESSLPKDGAMEHINSPKTMDIPNSHFTLLHESHLFAASRSAKHFLVSLKQPHKILSTSKINGGERTTVNHIVNFQSMESNNHATRFEEILSLSKYDYHQQLTDSLKLRAESVVSMGTAASISNLVHTHANFKDLRIDAFVTAGVKNNALRAGDPANWYQTENGNRRVETETQNTTATNITKPLDDHGTINIIVLINHPLTSGAVVKAAAVISEAKAAALNSLAIPSKQSQYLATGTGTDQYAIAAPIDTERPQLDSASGHLKLGELLGKTVQDAVRQAIELQDGLSPKATRNFTHIMARFGLDKNSIVETLKAQLDQRSYQLLLDNVDQVMTDSSLVAAAYAYATLLDRANFGTFQEAIHLDILLNYAAMAAVAVSGKPNAWPEFRSQLSNQYQGVLEQEQAIELLLKAVALGWKVKWTS